MTNMKPADELLSVRQKIKDLQAREAELKEGITSGALPTQGDFAICRLSTRKTTRFDRKAAEAQLGSLARFDVSGEAVALLVDALEQVEA